MSEINDPPINKKLGVSHYWGRGSFVDEGGVCGETMFFNLIHEATLKTECVISGDKKKLYEAIAAIRKLCIDATKNNRKCIFIGNGGSSGIASHMAVDWTKNGGIRAIALNDAPTLTCLANDFGYSEVFAKQLEYYAQSGDVVIIVSSSGFSENILRSAEQAFEMGLDLVTLSGMNPENVLRRKGNISLYVPAIDYGVVEISHLSILHSVVSAKAH